MADGVRLDIVLTDDGEEAQRPAPPEGEGAQPGQPAKLEGESPEEVRGEGDKKTSEKSSTWLERLKSTVALLEGGAQRFERIMTPLASNDYLGAFKETVGTAAEGLSMLGPYGKAAATALQSVTGVVESLAGVVGSFIERGKQLAQFSPELAMSGARAEVTSMMADIREAQELGGGISRMQDAQTELMTMLRDTLLPLKRWVVETLAGMMEALVKLARDGYIVAQDIYVILENMPDLISFKIKGTLWDDTEFKKLMELIQTIRDGFRIPARERKPNPLDVLVDRAMADIMGRAVEAPARVDPIFAGAGIP